MKMTIRLVFGVLFYLQLNPVIAQSQDLIDLSSYETKYKIFGIHHGRSRNIRRSVENISTVVLQPGELFSFNQVVGERTRENGFYRAPVIANGRLTRGYGGGVCQTASTIYAAALYAGLKIIERHPHSRISSYIQPGLDATVDWSSKNLILENPFPFPVEISATITPSERDMEEKLRVSIRGPQKTFDIGIQIDRRRLSGFVIIELSDQTLQPGERIIVEAGSPKICADLIRNFIPLNRVQIQITEQIETIYQSSPRIVRIGSGTQ